MSTPTAAPTVSTPPSEGVRVGGSGGGRPWPGLDASLAEADPEVAECVHRE
ncbi:hypothetical protein JL106_20440, partial [Nakamurella sp. YIM 132084]|nr:hypothetical protein [Nakamurella leprariae]